MVKAAQEAPDWPRKNRVAKLTSVPRLVYVNKKTVHVLDPTLCNHSAPLSRPIASIDWHTRYLWVSKGLFCSGACTE